MTAGYVTGEQKINNRFKIGGRAFGGALFHRFPQPTPSEIQQPTTRTVPTHAQPHKPHAHSPYVCDNGGTWNHSLQRCDCLNGFGGKSLTVRRAQKYILNTKHLRLNFKAFGVIKWLHAQHAIVVRVKSLTV